MDSDSDLFESADEEFDSDEKNSQKKHDVNVRQLKSIAIKTNEEDSKSSVEISNKQLDVDVKKTNDNETLQVNNPKELVCENNKYDQGNVEENITEPNTITADKNNANTITRETIKIEKPKPRVMERKDRAQRTREPKTKLGVKLGTKISSKKSDIDWDTFEDLNKEADINKQVFSESKKNEYDIPPRLVSCWEEPMHRTPTPNKEAQIDRSPKLYSEKSDFTPDKNFWDHEADYMELPQEEKKENVFPILDKLLDTTNKEQASSSWSSWGNWGVSSILSSASLGVSTLTSSVSQGISTVLESGIGVPDPEELARFHKEQKEKMVEQHGIEDDDSLRSNSQIGFGLGNLVSGVTHITKLVETTGSNILTGGLDTLEVIGKKTMEVLQEGDPGLKKKRALFKIEQDKPVLSHILREAKEKAEQENKFLEERHIARKPHYETMFDDYQGLIHLEALEMLSKQCDIKLETLLETYTGSTLTDMQETMAQIKELCELPDEDEDNETNDIEAVREKIETAVNDLNIKITYEPFLISWKEIDSWLQDAEKTNENDVHEKAIESLAQLTAIAVEQYHKAGELLLVKERRSTVDEADSLVQLTIIFTGVIGVVAGKFSEKLNLSANGSANSETVNSLITNIFLEAANSSSYIQDAFNLLIPVLQVGAV